LTGGAGGVRSGGITKVAPITRTVNVAEAKARLSVLIDRAAAGE
jgi:hypothetical protein